MAVTNLTRLYQAVPEGQTFAMGYPPGENQASARSASGYVLADERGNVYSSGFTPSFDANVITITNTGMGTLGASRAFRFQYDKTSPFLISASRSLTLLDDGATLVWRGAGTGTITVPAGLPKNFGCALVQMGAGVITVTGSGATIRNADSQFSSGGQYAALSLIAVALDEYVLAGSTA